MDATSPPRTAWRQELLATLGLAWPIALTNLSQHAMAVTDALILGRLSTEALAAATLGANLYWAAMAAPLGTAFAAGPILAQARGAGMLPGGHGWMRQMRRGARASLAASLILLLPAMLLLWFSEAALLAAGQQPELAALAQQYLRAMMWSLIPFSGFLVLRGFLQAMERPGIALWIAGFGVAVNAVLCWALVFPAGLGVTGAGLATTLADTAMFVALLGLIARDRVLRRFRLMGRFWRIQPKMLAEVFRIGLPISGSMLLEIGVFSAAALAMGFFGAAAVAAHAVALQTAGLTFMVPLGIGQAATSRVGLFVGAQDFASAARAGWAAIGLGTGFMAMTALALILCAPAIAAAFLGAGDAAAVEAQHLAITLLTIAGVFQLADGIQVVATGALRGLKDTRVPMLVGLLGYWGLGMPIGLGLAHGVGVGPRGLWIGLASGLAVVAVLLLARWRRLARRSAMT